MGSAAQTKATKSYRARLTQRGFMRFEIMALESDRELIRSLARRLSEEGPTAQRVRTELGNVVTDQQVNSNGILAALRRSPLVDADINLSRPRELGRKIKF